jgi:GDPmannose 4,6-dehydratase
MFAVNGILFNHESPRRGETFVTRKITRAVARIKAGIQDRLYLGNTESTRDWGTRPSTWRHVADAPGGRARRRRARDRRRGDGRAVRGGVVPRGRLDHREHIEIDPSYYRPAEVNYLLGDPARAEAVLDWKAATHWEELARIMVEADVQLVEDQLAGRQVRVDR